MGEEQFGTGDHVTWKSHGEAAEGTVQRTITADTEAAGRSGPATTTRSTTTRSTTCAVRRPAVRRAQYDDPQYDVRSEKSGGTAVHKPGALEKD